MTSTNLQDWALRLQRGEITLADFLRHWQVSVTGQLPAASVDLDRQRRCGFPEVVYGEGKTIETLRDIFTALLERNTPVLATRVDEAKAVALCADFPQAIHNGLARTVRVHPPDASLASQGLVAVITAGTSDLPVAEEARETLAWMGIGCCLVQDVGVAGPHRLPARLGEFQQADAIVVVAGMEGALPSVVGGYVACPVIAVPTSVGYGASFGGLAALLGMLNSCAANVTVVNIDAGFKGGYVAGLIASGRHREGS